MLSKIWEGNGTLTIRLWAVDEEVDEDRQSRRRQQVGKKGKSNKRTALKIRLQKAVLMKTTNLVCLDVCHP